MDDLPVRYRFGMGRLRHRQIDQQARHYDNCGISDRHGMRSPPFARIIKVRSGARRFDPKLVSKVWMAQRGACPGLTILLPVEPSAREDRLGRSNKNSSILATPVALIGILEHHGNSTDWRYRCAGTVL